jgi:uncharacterized protein (TIGR02145 family)
MTIKKALLMVFLAVSIDSAQSINISGKVTDSGGVAILGAIIKLEKLGYSDTTESNGSFRLTDGATGISGQLNQTLSHNLSAIIHNGLLCVNVGNKSAVKVTTFNLNGEALSTIQKSMDAGINSIILPRLGTGVYLYKLKSGNNEFVLKSNSIGGISQGGVVSVQAFSAYNALAKQAKVTAAINDVIAVTKNGYLNYRSKVTNSDTSGIEIWMVICAGGLKDADSNVYQTVKIGNQVWTAENLRTTKYNDVSSIPLVADSLAWNIRTTPGYCYNNNTTNADSIIKFGALYNWYVVDPANPKKVAPEGWHVPTFAEWDTLSNYLITNGYNSDGKALAAKVDWSSWPRTGTVGNDLASNNGSGFSAIPCGARIYSGEFTWGDMDFWWSTTVDTAHLAKALSRSLSMGKGYLDWNLSNKSCGFSIRLLKD